MKCDDCGTEQCNVCGHDYGDHYGTYDGSYMGCAACADCEGFGCASNSRRDKETYKAEPYLGERDREGR